MPPWSCSQPQASVTATGQAGGAVQEEPSPREGRKVGAAIRMAEQAKGLCALCRLGLSFLGLASTVAGVGTQCWLLPGTWPRCLVGVEPHRPHGWSHTAEVPRTIHSTVGGAAVGSR